MGRPAAGELRLDQSAAHQLDRVLLIRDIGCCSMAITVLLKPSNTHQVASLMQIPGWKWQPRRLSWDQRVAELNDFRNEYGREPRIRSGWEIERALAHWYSRQRKAATDGKLTPNQVAVLEGEPGLPTAELVRAMPLFRGGYEKWFREFWEGLVDVGYPR